MQLGRYARFLAMCGGVAAAVLLLPAVAQGQQILSDAHIEEGKASAAVINLGDEIAIGEARADRPGDGDGLGGSYTFLRVGEDDLVEPTMNPEGLDTCIPLGASSLCVLLLHSANQTTPDNSDGYGALAGLVLDSNDGTAAGLLVGESSAGNERTDSGFTCGAQAGLILLTTEIVGNGESLAIDSDSATSDDC